MHDKPVSGWLTHACGITVEHLPCPRLGATVIGSVPAAGVIHTIEGSLESGLQVFKQHYAPTFAVGGMRIVQLVPLGYEAAALEHNGPPETNRWARAQIEVQGHSQQKLWNLHDVDPATFETLAHLLAALSFPEVAGIPLTRPFPDDIQPGGGIWASPAFVRRHAGKWGHVAGWYGHIDMPGNEHWDPGELAYAPLLQRARIIATAATPPAKPKRLPSKHKLLDFKHRLFPLSQPISEHGAGQGGLHG